MEIWTEKYRPNKFEDIVGQKDIVKKVQAMVDGKNVQNLLFSGPPGTGKTTLALIIAKQLFKDKWKENFLELNSSDERGIDVIRKKVKEFARTRAIGDFPFKIILLDEADSLTKEAQHALRRTMEKYTKTARIILDCNFSSKIIAPIQSRCAFFRFNSLGKDEIINYIKRIEKNENLKISKDAYGALYESCGGDARKAVNVLQSCASVSKEITPDLIYSMASYAKPEDVKKVILFALSGELRKARNLMFDLMLNYGLSGIDTIKELRKYLWDLDVPDEKKVEIINKIGEYEFRLVEGSDPFIQIEALLAQLVLIGKDGRKPS